MQNFCSQSLTLSKQLVGKVTFLLSFWVGAATSAALLGIPDYLIRAMGRWSSDAYLLYINIINIPRQRLSSVSKSMATFSFNLIKLMGVMLHSRLIVQVHFYCFTWNYAVFASICTSNYMVCRAITD